MNRVRLQKQAANGLQTAQLFLGGGLPLDVLHTEDVLQQGERSVVEYHRPATRRDPDGRGRVCSSVDEQARHPGRALSTKRNAHGQSRRATTRIGSVDVRSPIGGNVPIPLPLVLVQEEEELNGVLLATFSGIDEGYASVDNTRARQEGHDVHVLPSRGQAQSVYTAASTTTAFDSELLDQLACHVRVAALNRRIQRDVGGPGSRIRRGKERVRFGAKERLDHFNAPPLSRGVEEGCAAGPTAVDIRACLDQRIHHFRVSGFHSKMERGGTHDGFRFQICAGLDQHLGQGEVPFLSRN